MELKKFKISECGDTANEAFFKIQALAQVDIKDRTWNQIAMSDKEWWTMIVKKEKETVDGCIERFLTQTQCKDMAYCTYAGDGEYVFFGWAKDEV